MLIKKEITFGVDIGNVISLYTSPDNLINICRHKLTGKCYKSCFIVSIDRIIRQSACIISQGGNPSSGTVHVVAEVSAIEYRSGDVICGVKVSGKDASEQLICHAPNAVIVVRASQAAGLESIVKDQIISVRVIHATYSIGSPTIALLTVFYFPDQQPLIYEISEPIDQQACARILSLVTEEETKLKTIPDKLLRFFQTILAPYKEIGKAPPGAKLASVKSILTMNKGFISRDPRLTNADSPFYSYAEYDHTNVLNDILPGGEMPKIMTAVSSTAGVINVLTDYYNNLRIVREMAEIYATDDDLRKHKNIWAIYGLHRK